MNALSTVLIAATVVVAGAGPFVAVYIGGKAFDDYDQPDHDDELSDDTTQLPRVADGPYNY